MPAVIILNVGYIHLAVIRFMFRGMTVIVVWLDIPESLQPRKWADVEIPDIIIAKKIVPGAVIVRLIRRGPQRVRPDMKKRSHARAVVTRVMQVLHIVAPPDIMAVQQTVLRGVRGVRRRVGSMAQVPQAVPR